MDSNKINGMSGISICLNEDILTNIKDDNKSYIIRYSIILIIISLTLAIIGLIDYHKGWTSTNQELLVGLYGINWFVLALNIMYFINTKQRASLVEKLKLE